MALLQICIILYFGYFIRISYNSNHPKLNRLIYFLLVFGIFIFTNTAANLISFYYNPYREQLHMISVSENVVKFYNNDGNHVVSYIKLSDIKYIHKSNNIYSLYELRSFKNDSFFINMITNYELTIAEE